jgi:hypothetical protein
MEDRKIIRDISNLLGVREEDIPRTLQRFKDEIVASRK